MPVQITDVTCVYVNNADMKFAIPVKAWLILSNGLRSAWECGKSHRRICEVSQLQTVMKGSLGLNGKAFGRQPGGVENANRVVRADAQECHRSARERGRCGSRGHPTEPCIRDGRDWLPSVGPSERQCCESVDSYRHGGE